MCTHVKYPVGQQSFEQIRKGGYLYVDKTHFIEELINGGQYFFLGRPRRFGKSLFLSTLKCFFEGKRELFEGLYIDSPRVDWDWEEYPVIVLDFNTKRYKTDTGLDLFLEDFLRDLELKYKPEYIAESYSKRFANIIETAARKTGKNVVILVDEYDKALVNNIHDHEKFEHFRTQLAEVYSNFKSSAEYIRMVFITGVSRFGKLSIFSDLNNIADLSFDDRYSAVCGITEAELHENFKPGIQALADKYRTGYEDQLKRLKQRFDGYHFTEYSEDIYNPFSLLNTFDKSKYMNYWIASGTPTLLLEQLKRTNADLEKLLNQRCTQTKLSGLDIANIDPVSLFYQTGYLTIKEFDEDIQTYTLGIPNDEVREGFLEFILPAYANLHNEEARILANDLREFLQNGQVVEFMEKLKSIFDDTSYELKMDEELNVQNALYILVRLLGMRVDAEYRTSKGRIDILIRTSDYVYIIELKFNKSAGEALEQIKRKEYTLPWKTDNRQIIAVGSNFSTKDRTIDDWDSKRIS